ncbi:MAG: hypothetical protein ACRDOB_06630 [Streptosporangiaceae bacterium]
MSELSNLTLSVLAEAGQNLGAPALIHQFQRLERDIGRAALPPLQPRAPHAADARGTAFLQAMDHPSVRAIAPPSRPPARQPA